MSPVEKTILLISDFNITNFSVMLQNELSQPQVRVTEIPYGQHFQVLTDRAHSIWDSSYDVACVWTRPEAVSQSFLQALQFEPVNESSVFDEVDHFCNLVNGIKDRVKTLLVPTWVTLDHDRNRSLLDMNVNFGIARMLMRMNLRLAENLDKVTGSYVLDAGRWVASVGETAWDPKLWYMGKISYGSKVFKEAAQDIKSAISGIEGSSRKVLFLDLDNTLWGGIVGDDGWEQLDLGAPDPIGEAFFDFQAALKSLSRKGILLAIVSKNDPAIALEAIEKHPDMLLRTNDFSGVRINWLDKAVNIIDLLKELNLGPESAVFIDDNPAERARVMTAIPEILVPEWPKSPFDFVRSLLSLGCFNNPHLTEEDFLRSQNYRSDTNRKIHYNKFQSLDDWLETLNTEVLVEDLADNSQQRTVQLLNKTNQMNLSTRRLTEAELSRWLSQRNRKLWTFRVSDRFGDSGLTGILSIEENGRTISIIDYVLSCRVMGRKIEESMLYVAWEYACFRKMNRLVATYKKTPRNSPCLDLLMRSEFQSRDNLRFELDTKKPYLKPSSVRIRLANSITPFVGSEKRNG